MLRKGFPSHLRRPVKCLCTTSAQKTLAAQFIKSSFETGPGMKAKNLVCKTTETDLAKHADRHIGLFYNVAHEEFQRWMKPGLRAHFYEQCTSFDEICLMIREASLEVINYLKSTNYDLPVTRYLLYGDTGSGKTTCMHHIMHYCGQQGWLIVHVPWASFWRRFCCQPVPSSYKEGRVDLPLDAASWLGKFKSMNEPVLKDLNLKVSRNYIWSKREVANEGSPLLESIDFALNRAKYASDVLGMVLKEIREQASANRFRVLVTIDGVNSFWSGSTIKLEDNEIEAENISIVHNFKKMLKNDWVGGSVVCTVDSSADDKNRSFLPKYLLGHEGYEYFHPHVPVHIPNYSDKEARSCIDYYTKMGWIQNQSGTWGIGTKELVFLSQNNPLELFKVTRSW